MCGSERGDAGRTCSCRTYACLLPCRRGTSPFVQPPHQASWRTFLALETKVIEVLTYPRRLGRDVVDSDGKRLPEQSVQFPGSCLAERLYRFQLVGVQAQIFEKKLDEPPPRHPPKLARTQAQGTACRASVVDQPDVESNRLSAPARACPRPSSPQHGRRFS